MPDLSNARDAASFLTDKLTLGFNARFRDELLNGELFYTLTEAKILIERWRVHYDTFRPHSALGYRPPALESIVSVDQRPTKH